MYVKPHSAYLSLAGSLAAGFGLQRLPQVSRDRHRDQMPTDLDVLRGGQDETLRRP